MLKNKPAHCIAGEIRPIPPIVYNIRDTVSALRQLAAAKHIGKIVLDVGSNLLKVADPQTAGRWVISGGLGALGALSGKPEAVVSKHREPRSFDFVNDKNKTKFREIQN